MNLFIPQNLKLEDNLKKGLAMIDFYESCGERNRLSKFGNEYIANFYIKLQYKIYTRR